MCPIFRDSFILVCALLLSVPPVLAQHSVILTARENLQSLNTHRVIERSGTSYTDVTQHGFRLGALQDGERIAVFRPSFQDDIRPFWQWTVKEVTWSLANANNSTLEMANLGWGFSSPPNEVHGMDRSPVSSEALQLAFEKVLRSNGSSTATTGFYLSSTAPLESSGNVNVTFWVTVEDPSTFLVEHIARNYIQVTPPTHGIIAMYPKNNYIVYWKSSRRGWADVYVDGVIKDRQYVTAGTTNRTCLFDDWLAPAGGNPQGEHNYWIDVGTLEDATVRSSFTTQTFTY